uniref:Rho GTPase activating protein 23b n=1 Tax=Monopterus albus TaxID=43700 RepID=A0A3Q3J8B6_MONAL|nr:rho GTPase-activating protein 21-like isoform X2 [Monopterus albus]
MAQAKGKRDGMVSSFKNRRRPFSMGEVEGVLRQRLRTIFLQKNSQGFGFTLRHFIVYPPESSLQGFKTEPPDRQKERQACRQDEDNGNALGKGFFQSCLEPMDTIFVKSVKENGSAQLAGLRTGDRLVEVNGESILGKTYSQVITLIQKSENILELSIMPKDEDVLQLAFSQGAYLKSNEPCSGQAQNVTDPPPFCCPSIKPTSTAPRPSHNLHSSLDNLQCQPGFIPSLLDSHLCAVSPPRCSLPRDPEDSSDHFALFGRNRSHSSSAISALDFHFANHNAAIVSAALTPLRKSSHNDALGHQALSDWYYSQGEAAERMSPSGHSISQDCLVGLGLGLAPGPMSVSTISAEQRRRETLLYHHQAATASHASYWLGGQSGVSGPGNSSCSESLLAACTEYEHDYERSVKIPVQASALTSLHYKHTSHSPQSIQFSKQKVSGGFQRQIVTGPITTSSTLPPSSRQSGQQVAEPQTRRIKEKELVDYISYSPFSHKTGHHFQQAHSFRDPSYSSSYLSRRPNSKDSLADNESVVVPKPQSNPILPPSEEERAKLGGREEISLNHKVVLRQKPPSRCWTPGQFLLHPHNNCGTVESPALPGLTPSSGTLSSVFVGPNHRASGSLAQHASDPRSSIPFIGSIKSRRSSYLLAITTERSKSCDEGLNTFREEGRVFSKLPKRVKSFFTEVSLERLQAEEEAISKRHSTSELGTITFSDVRKEGWLHYKQILTEKGKKVGGGMRPWKRVFSVLRSHSLFLYKDKREAVLHGAGAGLSQDEHPSISIYGCLIDISYSETKRKHTLRLTTQDFCEYLLQAKDRDDMLAWITVVRENSKTDNEENGITRQALINKKLNEYRKHSLTGNKPDSSSRAQHMIPPFLLAKTDNTSMNRVLRTDDNKAFWGINIMKKAKKMGSPKAFGVRLEDCQPAVKNKFVPLIVEMCCGVVEAMGLEYTGIYRVPGNNAMVSNLQEHLNKGMDINTAEEKWQDLNVMSSLLKSFFRKLPEPLFTDDKYSDFIDANRIADGEDRLKTMKKLIHDLPDHYFHTLKFLMGHLKRVADHSEKNKMEPRNLALVFGPTLVRTSEDSMTDMVTHMPDRYKIVETLILHYQWFFSDGEPDVEKKATEEKQDMQPVPNIDHLLPNIGRLGMPRETSDCTTRNSLRSKDSSQSKKDLNARDFLPKSIISVVTRKRKKGLGTHLPGSSTDEESEHEPVKASNYRKEEKGEEDRRHKEAVKGESISSKKDKKDEKGNRVEAVETTEGKDSMVGGEKAEKDLGKELGNSTVKFERVTRQKPVSLETAPQLFPNSFLYSHHQGSSTYSRAHPVTDPTSHLRSDSMARTHPTFCISPNRPLSLYQASSFHRTQQPDWQQPVPVHYRKTRGGRTRSVSMNLDLELGMSEDRVRGWRAERVEVIRVTGGGSGQHRCVGVRKGSFVGPRSIEQIDNLPCLAQEAPPLSSSLSGSINQSFPGSSTMVPRTLVLDPQDFTRSWCCHTVVV